MTPIPRSLLFAGVMVLIAIQMILKAGGWWFA